MSCVVRAYPSKQRFIEVIERLFDKSALMMSRAHWAAVLCGRSSGSGSAAF
jgi:hypothetical protein